MRLSGSAVDPTAEANSRDAAVAQIVARLSAEYLLRACQLLIETYGDMRDGIIAQTIIAANTAHLDARARSGRRYAGIDETPPDDLRRPISIARLAESLDLPFETTRRHVQHLTDSGVCIRVEGGLIVPRAVLEQPTPVRSTIANVGYVRKFIRAVQAAGLDEIGRPESAEAEAAKPRKDR